MKVKLVTMTIMAGLAVWLGASFVSPSDRTPMAGPVVAPDHGDSHRLGAMDDEIVELPSWDRVVAPGLDPLLGVLVSAD